MLVSLVLILEASHGNMRITGELFRNHLDFFFFFFFCFPIAGMTMSLGGI